MDDDQNSSAFLSKEAERCQHTGIILARDRVPRASAGFFTAGVMGPSLLARIPWSGIGQ
jgi:hypothetical protein